MGIRVAVVRYHGDVEELERAVASELRTSAYVDGTVLTNIRGQGDGTAMVTATGPWDLVDILMDWLENTRGV
jgi:hypothetical protein